ncbi:MAG: hypothetical protein ACXADC_13740 [Candidatus Thorarchaeota archaeon]|jgi:hypothetical protein
MQEIVVVAALLREISFGILLVGLFYTFGMFLIGRLASVLGEHGADHDVEKEIDHDVDHDYDVQHGEIEHDVEHDYDMDHGEIDHSVEHEYEMDHDLDAGYDHDVEHDVEKEFDHGPEYDADHEIEHDVDHDVEKDWDHSAEIDHDLGVEKPSGFFESDRGAPLGVTIGTSLLSFGFFGSIIYYEGIMVPFAGKFLLHVLGAALVVFAVRTVLGKVFVESGFMIEPRHLVGRHVEAVSTVSDEFGEVRTDTDMGLRRFHARPFQKGVIFEKGTDLYVVSANEKFVYVDPRKEAIAWSHKQSRKHAETEREPA